MKKIILVIAVLLIASTKIFAQTKAGKIDTTKHMTYYTCSSHPQVKNSKPGSCPICGMKLNLSGKEQMKAGITKNYNCPVHVDVSTHNPGSCPKCGRKLTASLKEQMKIKEAKLYTCPMHPEVALDKDGICPKCGKALVAKKQGK